MADIETTQSVTVEKTYDKVTVYDLAIKTNPVGNSTFVIAYRKYAVNEDNTWDLLPIEIEPIQRLEITIPQIIESNAAKATERLALLQSLTNELVLVAREQGLNV